MSAAIENHGISKGMWVAERGPGGQLGEAGEVVEVYATDRNRVRLRGIDRREWDVVAEWCEGGLRPPSAIQRAIGELEMARRYSAQIRAGRMRPDRMVMAVIEASMARCVERLQAIEQEAAEKEGEEE